MIALIITEKKEHNQQLNKRRNNNAEAEAESEAEAEAEAVS